MHVVHAAEETDIEVSLCELHVMPGISTPGALGGPYNAVSVNRPEAPGGQELRGVRNTSFTDSNEIWKMALVPRKGALHSSNGFVTSATSIHRIFRRSRTANQCGMSRQWKQVRQLEQ